MSKILSEAASQNRRTFRSPRSTTGNGASLRTSCPLSDVEATAVVVSNMIETGIFTTTGFLAGDLRLWWSRFDLEVLASAAVNWSVTT